MDLRTFATLACDASLELDELVAGRHQGPLIDTQAVHDWIMENVVDNLDGLWIGIAITHSAALETDLVDRTLTDVNDFRPVMAARCQEMAALINAPTEASEDKVKTMGDWCFALFTAAVMHDKECNQPRHYLHAV